MWSSTYAYYLSSYCEPRDAEERGDGEPEREASQKISRC